MRGILIGAIHKKGTFTDDTRLPKQKKQKPEKVKKEKPEKKTKKDKTAGEED